MPAKHDWPLLASENALRPSGHHPIFQGFMNTNLSHPSPTGCAITRVEHYPKADL